MKAAMLIAAMMLAAGSQAQTEQLTVPLSDPGKPFTLNIGLLNGSIKIVGYEGKDIVIDAVSGEARKRERLRDKEKEKGGVNTNINVNVQPFGKEKENASGMKRLNGAGNGMEITVEEKSNRVTINSDSYKRPIDFVIKVPMSSAKLKISTVNDGDISISNVSGEMEIENTNGDISVTNVSGSVVANTTNGWIVAALKTVDGKTPMAFSTLNGKVDVTLPADIKVSLKAKSDMGQIYSDFDVTIDKTAPKITRSNEKGMYKLNIEDWVQGKINGGGPELLIKSFNGSIYVRKAK